MGPIHTEDTSCSGIQPLQPCLKNALPGCVLGVVALGWDPVAHKETVSRGRCGSRLPPDRNHTLWRRDSNRIARAPPPPARGQSDPGRVEWYGTVYPLALAYRIPGAGSTQVAVEC